MTFVTASATGSAAVITLPSVSGLSYTVTNIACSYSSIPFTAGRLTVKFDSTIVYDLDIPSNGILIIDEDFPTDTSGQSVEIRLSGSVGLTAKLNASYISY